MALATHDDHRVSGVAYLLIGLAALQVPGPAVEL
jgi:hypothetical protein